MRLLYTKPRLNDLSQGSRIAFARQFRTMSQDEVSDILGLTGECKRRTMTRYEKGDRNPKLKRLEEISSILKVNINSLKEYDFNNPIDVVYIFIWMDGYITNSTYTELPFGGYISFVFSIILFILKPIELSILSIVK